MSDERIVHLSPPRPIMWAGIFVLVMLGLFLLAEMISAFSAIQHPTSMPSNVITVSGQGTASLAPDIAHVTFTVQNTDTTVADAQAATTKQANAAIESVKGQGIADKDVTTLSYNISPQYSYTRCYEPTMSSVSPSQGVALPPCTSSSRITGYQVSETVQVTVHDLTKISALLQSLGTENVQNISGPDFALNDPNAGSDAARAQAIDNAKQQAEILAKQLGVHLGRIVSFSESGGYPYPMYSKALGMGGATMDAAAPAPSIPVGQNQYSANVSITYEID